MEIKSISQKIFRTKSNSIESNSSQTNPFGVNYKGNMINADVFFTGKEKAVANAGVGVGKKISNHINKLTDAWKVGAMGSFSEMSNRFDASISRVKAKAVQVRKYLTETNVEMPQWLSGKDSKNSIKKKEMPAIRTIFQDLADSRAQSAKEAA